MIDYILRSTICLATLLAVYHFFLENEKMHKFNRYFLLFSLAVSFIIPMLTIKAPIQPLQSITLTHLIDQPINLADTVPADISQGKISAETKSWDWFSFALLVYGTGAMLFAGRFVYNLTKIAFAASRSQQINVKHGVVILLPENVLPHTFLHYIFFSKEECQNKAIDDQLFAHELAHVKQRHSLDVLLIELLQVIFWFNPVFIFYKRAIQLNHEFLADQSVITRFNEVTSYQQLLLSKMIQTSPTGLASSLTYSLTKKRLMIMRKDTPRSRAIAKKMALMPLLAAMILLFSSSKITTIPVVKNLKLSFAKPDSIDYYHLTKDQYYKDALIKYKAADGRMTIKKYEDMTVAEKSLLKGPARPPKKISPSSALYATWKGSEKYDIWVNGKHIATHGVLSNYKPSDFSYYWSSRLMPNAIHYGVHRFQVELYGQEYFVETYVKPLGKPGKKIVQAVFNGNKIESVVNDLNDDGRARIPVKK